MAAAENDALAAELQRYLLYVTSERNVGSGTLANYRRDITQFTIFLRGQQVGTVAGVNRPLLREWASRLRHEGRSAASLARRANEIRAFVRYICREGDGQADPFAGWQLPKPPARTGTAPSPAEVARLLGVPPGTPLGLRDRAVLEVLYAAGLQVSDLVRLDVRQVSLATREILRWDKGGRARPTFLGSSAVRALEEYLADGRPLLRATAGEAALFLSQRGRRLSTRAVQELVERHARAAGLKITPRDLRLACAAHLRAGGASAGAVRQLLGVAQVGKS